jgi:hypothetical protein
VVTASSNNNAVILCFHSYERIQLPVPDRRAELLVSIDLPPYGKCFSMGASDDLVDWVLRELTLYCKDCPQLTAVPTVRCRD